MFADSTELLIKAISYLNKPSMRITEQLPTTRKAHKPYPRGENCHSSKLTNEKVKNIRAEYAQGKISYPALGKKYDLHPVHIARVVRREVWANVE